MRSAVGKWLPLANRTASVGSREPDLMPDICLIQTLKILQENGL